MIKDSTVVAMTRKVFAFEEQCHTKFVENEEKNQSKGRENIAKFADGIWQSYDTSSEGCLGHQCRCQKEI